MQSKPAANPLMKNTPLALLLAVLALGGAASIAHAGNDDVVSADANVSIDHPTDADKGGWRDNRMDKRQDMKDRMEDRREGWDDRGPGMRFIGMANIGIRHTWMIKRLENIADRIDARIKILKDDGKNTAEAEMHMREARTDIADAKEDIKRAQDVMTQVFASIKSAWDDKENDSRGEIKAAVKADIQPLSGDAKTALMDAKKELLSAHTHLKASIEVIKSLE